MDKPHIEVDLSTKKTEAGWLEAQDRFWLAFTPKLFEWLEWGAVLWGFRFFPNKNRKTWLGFLRLFCTVAMLFYFMAFFYRFKFVGIPWLQSERAHRLVSLAISGALAIAAIEVAAFAVDALSNVQP